MYRSIFIGVAAGVVLSASVFAAEGWGINHEKVTRVEAKVVDNFAGDFDAIWGSTRNTDIPSRPCGLPPNNLCWQNLPYLAMT